jgi:hypothetical protein
MLLAAAMVACTTSADDEPVLCHNPEAGIVRIGTGSDDTGFQPLEDGGDLALLFGVNGMYLLSVSLEVARFEFPSEQSTLSQVGIRMSRSRVGDDAETVAGTLTHLHAESRDDLAEFLGIRCTVVSDEVDNLLGDPIQVDAEVVDGCGRVLEAGKTVNVVR